jgi:hypothetical protein
MRPTLVILALLAVLAAGCGSDDDGATGGGGSQGGNTTLSGPLTYQRGGGIAGRIDKLEIQADGKATLTTRGGKASFQLTDDELEKITDELAAARLPEVESDLTTTPPSPDAFGYRVVYEGKTVTTDSAAMPNEVSGVMSALGKLVDEHDPKG